MSQKSTSIFLEVARSLQNELFILRTLSLVQRLLPRRGGFCILQIVQRCRDARTIGKVRSLRPDLGSGSRPVHLLRRGFEGGDEQKEEAAECEGEEEADFADAD